MPSSPLGGRSGESHEDRGPPGPPRADADLRSRSGRAPRVAVLPPPAIRQAAQRPASLDHLCVCGELRRIGEPIETARQFLRCRLGHRAAGLADEEGHRFADVVSVLAGHEGIARGEPVHEAVFEQEIERPVHRDRRRPFAGFAARPVRSVHRRRAGAGLRGERRARDGGPASAEPFRRHRIGGRGRDRPSSGPPASSCCRFRMRSWRAI